MRLEQVARLGIGRMTDKVRSFDHVLSSQNTSFAPVSLRQQVLYVRSCILICAKLTNAGHYGPSCLSCELDEDGTTC